MRLNKIFAAATLCTMIAAVAFSQATIRIGAYDSSQANWWNTDPMATVFDPNQATATGVLFIDFTPDQEWVQQNPAPGMWSTVSFSFIYDTRYIDFIVYSGTTAVRLGDIATPSGIGLSQYLAANTGYFGVAAGSAYNLGGTRREIVLTLANTANTNGDEFNDSGNGFGYAVNFIQRSVGPANPLSPPPFYRRLIQVELKPQAIANDLNGALILERGREEAFRNIKVSAGGFAGSNFTGEYRLDGKFLVPEPASMIALGSGLVGLLALRRRRAN